MSHGDLGNRGGRTEPQTPLVGVVDGGEGGGGVGEGRLSGKGYPLAEAGLPAMSGNWRGKLAERRWGIAEMQGFPPVGVAWWVGFIQWAELPGESRLLGSRACLLPSSSPG